MDNTQNKKRNNYIDLLRFLFCLIIFIHHSGHVTGPDITLFPSGGLAADAFFMLTGYYAVKHFERLYGKNRIDIGSYPEEERRRIERPVIYCIRYTLKKLISAFPYMATGTVMIYLLEILIKWRFDGTPGVVYIIGELKDMILELLYLPLTGIMGALDGYKYRNAPMWYLSAILIALPVLTYIAAVGNKVFKRILVWICPILLQIFMIVRFGGVLPWQQFAGPFSSGIIRGFSSMLMGGAIYYLAEFLKDRFGDDNTLKRIIATIAEISLFIIFIVNVIRGVHGVVELLSLYVIAVSLVFSLSELTYTSCVQSRTIAYLGRLSLPVFCLHWGVYRWISAFLGYLDYKIAMVLAFVICMMGAAILMYLTGLMEKKNGRI